MTTKQSNAVETITLETPQKPYFLRLVGPTVPVLQECVVHIRSGYCFAPEAIEFFGGSCAITLHLGQPEPYVVEKAAQALAEAMARDAAEHKRAVAEEAKRLVEQEKKDALAKRLADAEAASAQALAAVRKEVAAELSQLDK